jgi:cytidylate kinase
VKHFNHARNKEIIDSLLAKIAELEVQLDFEMEQKDIARQQRQIVISRLNSYLIKRANEIGECLPMYLVDHIKEFKGGAK